MELKFIWIDDYGIIKDLNVNFDHSGAHTFHYEDSSLSLIENEPGILDFGPRIHGITAIAGQNGSGKSSMCEVTLSTIATLRNGGMGYNIRFRGIVCIERHIFYHESLPLTNKPELVEAGYELIPFQNSPLEQMRPDWRETFIKEGFIYYSNVLDLRSGFDNTNMTNISTQTFIVDEYRTGTDFIGEQDRPHHVSDFKRYQIGQGYRIMKFYLVNTSFIPFEGPQFLSLKSVYSANSRWININSVENLDFEYSRLINSLQNEVFELIFPANRETSPTLHVDINIINFKLATHQLYRLNLVKAVITTQHSLPEYSMVREFVFEYGIIFAEELNEINILAGVHKQLVDLSDIQPGQYQPYILKYDYPFPYDWRFPLIESSWIPNNEKSRELLSLLLTTEESLFIKLNRSIGRISNYSFAPYFSAGEYSFLTFYSRLRAAIDEYSRDDEERNNLVLFIDEAEVGFHPAWKKRFLFQLLDFLNNHTERYTYQIILTTHSPYLLSDLSTRNIILLKRGDEGHTQIIPSGRFTTFGANIHELLAHSFFLEDGTIGEFAKRTIQNVINDLNVWRIHKANYSAYSPSESEKNKVRDIISIVSDDIVRNKLMEMYLELVSSDNAVDEEIIFLEKRLNDLKQRNNDSN